MKIICISGKAGSGKDTLAGFLAKELQACDPVGDPSTIITVHYADLLKFICEKYFGWNSKKNPDGRTLLQYIGTHKIRRKNPDYWVDFIIQMLKFFPDDFDYVLIPDCRFPNEVERLREEGFDVTLVRIIRENYKSELTVEQQNDISETAMDNYDPDYEVLNDGTISDLKRDAGLLANAIVF